jgi:precorrin-6A synthase
MRTIFVIGIGAGDPDYLTLQAIKALNQVDVFFFIDKGSEKDDLIGLRTRICEEFIENTSYRIVHAPDPERDRDASAYGAAVTDWHEQRAQLYQRLIRDELAAGECGAFLVWGDPALYDGTLRIIDRVLARGEITFEYTVIPGISSVQSLAARHRIPLNRTGESVHITTGRQLAARLARTTDSVKTIENVFVMLDARCAFSQLDDPDLDIYWGAYLGTIDETLIAGRLTEVSASIVATRAALRQRKGWIMDTYLLRRRSLNQ